MSSYAPATHVGGYPVSKSLLCDLTKIRAPYNDIPIENAYTGKKLEHDWTLHLISDDSRVGYDGALFSAQIGGKPHYFIYHQGSNDVKDIPSVARLGRGRMPQQADDAKAFNAKAMAHIQQRHPGEDVPVTQVGYSLGSSLAMLVADDKQPIIAFEGVGSKKFLEEQGFDSQSIGQRTLEVLSPHPNAINSHEEHVGGILYAGEKFWQTNRASVMDFARMTAQTHNIKNIGLALATMDEFPQMPASEVKRPTEVFDALGEYLDDYVGKDASLREKALKGTTELLDKTGIDKLITAMVVIGADTLTSKISKELMERNSPQAYRRPVTHPDVTHKVPEMQPQRAPEQDNTPQKQQESAPTKSHAAQVLAERGQATAQGMQR